jgi:hypothetical protein
MNRRFLWALLLLTMIWWSIRERQLLHARQAIAHERQRIERAESRLQKIGVETAALRQSLKTESTNRNALLTKVAMTQREAENAAPDPDLKWSSPPDILPLWQETSPYVWVRKEILPRLPVKVFGSHGEIDREIARMLAIRPDESAKTSRALQELVKDFRAQEAAKVERTVEPPSEKHPERGPKITITIPPLADEGKQVQSAFESLLRSNLGTQRADLMMKAGADWIAKEFSAFGAKPKTISAERTQTGGYQISIKTGGYSMSVGGVGSMNDYVPPHLRPFFAPLADEAVE